MAVDDVTIRPTKLYKMRSDLQGEEFKAAYVAGIRPDTMYWVESVRRAHSVLMGGYYANVYTTYYHRGAYSPKLPLCENLPLRYLEPVPSEQPAWKST